MPDLSIPRSTNWRIKVVPVRDRKSTRLNSSHSQISYAVFCLKKKIAVELERVREPRAPPALHAHPQEDGVVQALRPLELLDLVGRGLGQRNRHRTLPSLSFES